MNRTFRLSGISIVALLLFAFPETGLSGDWLEQYIAAATISASESVDPDNPNKPSLDAFLRLKDADAKNKKTFDGPTYRSFYDGIE